MKKIAALFFAALFISTAAEAQIYKWVDADGKTHYSQSPPPKKANVETKQLSPAVRQASRTKKIVSNEVNSKYCSAIKKFAINVSRAMRRGVPASSVNSATLDANEELKRTLGTRAPIIKQIVSFVYGFKHTQISSLKIGDLAHGQCLNGAYGRGTAEQKRSGRSGGTGWAIEGDYVLTNHHVVTGSKDITLIFSNGKSTTATVELKDEHNDIAVLKVADPDLLPPPIRLSKGQSGLGVEVFTIGFPHPDLMGSKPKLTTGHVNATSGMRDDPRMYQISVPLQSGNSGGPLLNLHGEAIGIVTAKLNATKIYEATGDLTQNVNYAIKVEFLHRLLNSKTHSPSATPHSRQASSLSKLATEIEPSIVMVIAK
jgi:S1-C subfamily serine protease